MMSNVRRSGFTLIELLVAIAIIALLVSITVVVGANVLAGGRSDKTRDAMRTLTTALDEYIADQGAIPSATILDPDPDVSDDDKKLWPVADAVFDVDGADGPRLLNSLGLFMRQLEEVPAASEQLSGLDQDFLRTERTYLPSSDAAVTDTGVSVEENETEAGLPTIFDGWNRPIRYVHPTFDGRFTGDTGGRSENDPGNTYDFLPLIPALNEDIVAIQEIRRNRIVASEYGLVPLEHRDSDGGLANNDRPYFYSAGPDGDPSTVEDNVYLALPRFQEPEFN